MNTKKMVGLGAMAVLMGAMGCAEEEGVPPAGGSDVVDPVFAEGQGQAPVEDEKAYPAGPYGWEVGAIARDIEFIGYENFVDPAAEGLQAMKLSDFYNPTGDGVFPKGSPFGEGVPKPQAVIVVMSARWCPPCQYEAPLINDHMTTYGDSVQFVSVLLENTSRGQAEVSDLIAWGDAYDVQYPLVLDPDRTVMRFYEPAFPGNVIIDTTDMRIIDRIAGVPEKGSFQGDAFWATLEDVIAE